MESKFARLFRTSKLASYDREIKQVYATYANKTNKGEWGLKRRMPPRIPTRLATISSLDTKEQITDFENGNPQYMLTNTWKENFPESHSPGHRKSSGFFPDINAARQPSSPGEGKRSRVPQRNLGLMTRAEWKAFLAEARSRRSEWKDALEEGHFAPEETLAFMNATNIHDSQDDGVVRSPTYHDYVPASEELIVQGRVLNHANAGYAVAVQGIIAYLPPQSKSMETGFGYRDIKTFYVHSAKFDSQGRPDVLLGMKPRGSRDSISLDSGPRSAFKFGKTVSNKNTEIREEYLGRIRDILKLNKSLSESVSGDEITDAVDHITKDRK
ncbi:hypothetical protein GGI15_001555 [Coemansia interrupta]|uniref:Uncharacterized protein n=1 Tax=Coemansia interrupta TaxID=1126814 RepID=A0A9W8HJJ3_9FUNG|nr:hypothetical protein GGI15_001555 [Coemansia interrupta]